MGQIIRISKTGYNAGTETSANNLIFSSDYNTLKYHQIGTIVVSNSATGTVSHGLGYVPFFIAMVAPGGDPNYYTCPYMNLVNDSYTTFYEVFADTNNLYVRTNIYGGGNVDAIYKYFIFRNNLGLL